ncbi:hypothetical protein AAF712_010163 [Marasmius tenuissimus]|uniref:Uncharacterized protein n=1 Tax=Marasmius tenuissimus TaxID=585030 RepID=A0ABR2ZMQ1_9AGAR
MEDTNPMEEVNEFEQELVREQEEWDRLGHGISQGTMLTDAQWMATIDEHVGPLGDWLEPWLLSRFAPLIQQDASNNAQIQVSVEDCHVCLRYCLATCPPELRPIADMTKSNLWMLLELYVGTELNGVDEINFGIERVTKTFRPCLPN